MDLEGGSLEPAAADGYSQDSVTSEAARHLQVLRDQLRRDYLTRADWDYALFDLAKMTREALDARQALVALYSEETKTWSAYTSDGKKVADEKISKVASRSVLESVRVQRAPFLQSPADLGTSSVRSHGLQSVVGVPLYWWDVKEQQRQTRFGGCLYAHRTWTDAVFSEADVALVLDITEIAQRTLNVLRYLQIVETDLAASKEKIRGLEAQKARLGSYESADPWFSENVLGVLQRAARHDRVGVLILGPTGSGKSYLAQAFHHEGPRKDGPFHVLDCSQVTSDESLAAELFGYSARSGFANSPEKGRPGLAAQAHRGTLFIEEIGVLPPHLQQRLLALLETGVYSPLGSSEKMQVDLQVLAATNEDLPRLVREGRFREDLFWRLGEVTVRLPSLDQRPADVPGLARRFLKDASRRFGRTDSLDFTPRALQALQQHDWAHAGNLRGLQQTLHRTVLLLPPEATQIDVKDLPFTGTLGDPAPKKTEKPVAEKPTAPTPELDAILEAIRVHGSGTAAAKALGITRGVLIWQLRKAGLTVNEAL